MAIFRIVVVVLLLSQVVATAFSKDFPGAAQTSFTVSPSGSFDFSVPIVAPNGVNGVQPNLAISYSSGRGNGRLGVGWDLTGLSAILRCGDTLATNGQITGVKHSNQDKFCLNGQQLILVSGTYGAANSEYRTEIDDVSKIVALGSSSNINGGSSPTHFHIYKKDGTILKYGVGGNSAVKLPGTTTIHCWKLGRVEDRSGNYYQVSYRTSDGQPSGIDYTLGNSAAEHAIDFVYEGRNDVVEHYTSGKKIAKPNRIKRINVSTKGSAYRTYHMTYRYAPVTGRSQLTGIKECGSGTSCMPTIPINWVNDVKGYSTAPSEHRPKKTMVESQNNQHGVSLQVHKGTWADVNGDGWVDQVISYRNFTGTHVKETWLGSKTGFTNGGTAWQMPVEFRDYTTSIIAHNQIAAQSIEKAQLIDVNGDGLPDVVFGYRYLDDLPNRQAVEDKGVYLNTGNGWGTLSASSFDPPEIMNSYTDSGYYGWHPNPSCHDGQCFYTSYVNVRRGRFVDLNGDGLVDWVTAYSPHKRWNQSWSPGDIKQVYINNGSNWAPSSTYVFPDAFSSLYRQHRLDRGILIDLNGDGLPDWLQSYKEEDGSWNKAAYLNTGSTFVHQNNTMYELPDIVYDGAESWENPVTRGSFVDVNGDGLLDYLRDGDVGSKAAWINTAQGWESSSGYAPQFEQKTHTTNDDVSVELKGFYVDVNHDGLVDYVQSYKNSSGTHVENVWRNTGSGWSTSGMADYKIGLPFFQRTTKNGFTYSESLGQFTDINADGSQDWVQARSGLSLTAKLDKNGKTERLEKITTTAGVEVKPEFKSLTEDIKLVASGATPLYIKRTAPAITPTETNAYYLATPFYVASKLSVSAPNGSGYNTSEYRYAGAKVDRRGRGFLGFQIFEQLGISTGLNTKTEFEQSFPKTGRPKEVTMAAASHPSHWLSKTQNTYAVHTMHNGKTVMPFAQTQIVQQRELATSGGDSNKQVSYTRSGMVLYTGASVKDYARLKSTTVETRATTSGAYDHKNLTEYTYHGADETNWFVAQVDRTTVTQSEPNDPTSPTLVSVVESDYYPSGHSNKGLLQSVTREPGGSADILLVTTYVYDSKGNVTSTQAASTEANELPRTESIEYYPSGRPQNLYNAIGQFSHIEQYDPVCDEPTKVQDIGGLTTHYAYDAFCRETLVTNPVGLTKETIFTHALEGGGTTPNCGGGVSCQTTPAFSVEVRETGKPTTTAFHNTHGMPILTKTSGMNLEPITQLVFYDDLGRVEKQSQPHYTSEVNNEHWTEFTYDLLGRETIRHLPYTNTYASGNAVVSTSYNVDQNQRKQTQTTPATEGAPTGSKKHTLVNALGQTIGIVDTNGHTLAYDYNARGNLIKTEATGVHASNALKTTTTTVSYDALGRRKVLNDPSLGRSEYFYNAYGDLKQQDKGPFSDGSTITLTMKYDQLGRLTRRFVPDETGALVESHWEYYASEAETGQLKYIGVGPSDQPVQDRMDAKYFFYDEFGRQNATTTIIKGQRFKQAITYNALGQVDSRGYPASGVSKDANGASILDGEGNEIPLLFASTYTYRNGFLETVSGQGLSAENCIEHWRATKYDALGRVEDDILGDIVDTQRTFKPGQTVLTNITSTMLVNGSDEVQNLSYQYDANNNLTSRTDSQISKTDTFKYDALDRMTFHNFGEADQVEVRYDDFGNIKYKQDVGSYEYNNPSNLNALSKVVASAGASNPLAKFEVNWEWNGEQVLRAQPQVHDTTYLYDERGNIKTQGNREFYWTAFDKPHTILLNHQANGQAGYVDKQSGSEIHYNSEFERTYKVEREYNGLGQETLAKSETFYVGKSYQRIKNIQSGEITHRYSIMAGGQTIQIERDHDTERDEPKYLLADNMGSTNVIINRLGEVAQRMHFDPWGMRTNIGDVDDLGNPRAVNKNTDKGYTGHETDDETGTINMNARIYDPYLGRFMSADPVLPDAENLQAFNRYAYVLNNAMKYTDPTGNSFEGVSFDPVTTVLAFVLGGGSSNARYGLYCPACFGHGPQGGEGYTEYPSDVRVGYGYGGIAGGGGDGQQSDESANSLPPPGTICDPGPCPGQGGNGRVGSPPGGPAGTTTPSTLPSAPGRVSDRHDTFGGFLAFNPPPQDPGNCTKPACRFKFSEQGQGIGKRPKDWVESFLNVANRIDHLIDWGSDENVYVIYNPGDAQLKKSKAHAYAVRRITPDGKRGRIEIVFGNAKPRSDLFRTLVAEEIFHAADHSRHKILNRMGAYQSEVDAHNFVLGNRAIIGFGAPRRKDLIDLRKDWRKCLNGRKNRLCSG